MKKFLPFILFVSITASAQLQQQVQRYDSFAATTTSASGIGNLMQAIPNATLTVFNAPAVGVSCAGGGCVAATTYTSVTGATACGGGLPLTRPTSTTCLAAADVSGNFGFWAAPGSYQYCIAAPSFTTQCYNVILGITNAGIFVGPNPWIDVTSPTYGAKCDGSTNDTTAIQNALNTANGNTGGGTVFFPRSRTGPCVVSSLNMNNFNNITLIDGLNPSSGNGNTSNATLKFTGTCVATACLLLQSTLDVTFQGVKFWFSGATAGPMIDLKKNGANPSTSNVRFHGGGAIGPGSTIGPIMLAQDVNFLTIDDWFQFGAASVFVEGPPTNASGTGLADSVIFDKVVFQQPGTSAVQNASVNWLFSNSNFALVTGTACAAALQYVGGFTNQQATIFTNNTFLYAAASCAGATTVISVPAAAATFGSLVLSGNLIAGPTAPANLSAINVGNNQFLSAYGNLFNSINTVYTVGTGVGVDIGTAEYNTITSFLSGTPSNGRVLDNNGITTTYGTLRATSAAFATATAAGTCVQNTTAVTGATTGMAVAISPVSTPGVGAVWAAFVSSAGNVTINECAVALSAGGTIAFNIRVIP